MIADEINYYKNKKKENKEKLEKLKKKYNNPIITDKINEFIKLDNVYYDSIITVITNQEEEKKSENKSINIENWEKQQEE